MSASTTAPPLMARRQQRSASLTRSRARSSSRRRYTSVFETNPTPPVPVPGCICHRPSGLVLCQICGWHHTGTRTRLPCPVHVRTLYLLDIEFCPKCRAYPPILKEIQ